MDAVRRDQSEGRADDHADGEDRGLPRGSEEVAVREGVFAILKQLTGKVSKSVPLPCLFHDLSICLFLLL